MAGSRARRNRPGCSVRDPSLGFDADAWQRFAAGLARVISRCRDRGYEPTFHPETGTHVEAPWEIERVLEVSDVGLCVETGHMLLGGGDPVAIGAGRMGRTHLRALAGSDRVRVAAVAEMSPAARAAVDAPGAELYESTAEMLDRAALDGVLIAAPTDQHSAIIAQVAARGVPILCEKPCGLSAAAARASAQVGVPLQVAYWRRFGPGRGAAAV